MKFTVEVDEFWIEEEELTEALRADVKRSVVQEISKSIESKVEKQITVKIKEVIDQKVLLIIDTVLTDLVATEVIVSNGQEISISDHVKNLFQRDTGWSNVNEQMQRISKKFGDELKLQYNNAFANKIVSNMKEQGLLKDEVVQILLGGE
ncbi:MAG: hypothetical protein KAT90_10285 [Gammaproteobacteria bacterium]|nr:hypothetical protein [Gammaproteobacteria bacterium]